METELPVLLQDCYHCLPDNTTTVNFWYENEYQIYGSFLTIWTAEGEDFHLLNIIFRVVNTACDHTKTSHDVSGNL
jgi:hypothetical protein